MKCARCKNEAVEGITLCQPCREKNKERNARYVAANKEKVLACKKRYVENNQSKVNASKKRYVKNNPEKIASYTRVNSERKSIYRAGYNAEHREERLRYNQRYVLINAKKVSDYQKQYSRNNRLKINGHKQKYRKANPDKGNSWAAQYRAKKLSAFISTVNRKDIFERDGYICQLCGTGVLPFVPHQHPMYPTIDHIIPLSKGGTHEPSNVQTAHLGCNASKGARYEISNGYVV